MSICRNFAVLTLILVSTCAFAQTSDQAQKSDQAQSSDQAQQPAPAQSPDQAPPAAPPNSDQAQQPQSSTPPQQPDQAQSPDQAPPAAPPNSDQAQQPQSSTPPQQPDQAQSPDQPQNAGQPQPSDQTQKPDQQQKPDDAQSAAPAPSPDQPPKAETSQSADQAPKADQAQTSEETPKPAQSQTPDHSSDVDLDWNWHAQEVIGRNDASLGTISQITEPERNELIDAIVNRLQKPMRDAGYDDDRIREIASTTRVRFVDLSNGRPVLFATSLGMEGGCDTQGNCPFWIFRHGAHGYVSMLDTDAASYTVQPKSNNDGFSDLLMLQHITPTRSQLTLYRAKGGKYTAAACYMALWPPPTDDPTKVTDPEIKLCEATTAEPKQDSSPETKQELAAPEHTTSSDPR